MPSFIPGAGPLPTAGVHPRQKSAVIVHLAGGNRGQGARAHLLRSSGRDDPLDRPRHGQGCRHLLARGATDLGGKLLRLLDGRQVFGRVILFQKGADALPWDIEELNYHDVRAVSFAGSVIFGIAIAGLLVSLAICLTGLLLGPKRCDWAFGLFGTFVGFMLVADLATLAEILAA